MPGLGIIFAMLTNPFVCAILPKRPTIRKACEFPAADLPKSQDSV
jgi:hypothetical protein